MKKSFLQILLGLLLLSLPSFSQKLEIGAGLGGMNYTGDLTENLSFRFFRPAGQVFVRYNLPKGLTLRGELLAGQLTASDEHASNSFQQQRGLSFKTFSFEGDVIAEYNFLDFVDRRNTINWTPYVFGGVGYQVFKPSPNTHGQKNAGIVLPFGVGLKYQIKRPWNVGAEFSARKTFTDYIDNFGGDMVDYSNKFNNGNPSKKDMYYYLGISISYTFYKVVCP